MSPYEKLTIVLLYQSLYHMARLYRQQTRNLHEAVFRQLVLKVNFLTLYCSVVCLVGEPSCPSKKDLWLDIFLAEKSRQECTLPYFSAAPRRRPCKNVYVSHKQSSVLLHGVCMLQRFQLSERFATKVSFGTFPTYEWAVFLGR